MSKNTMKLKLPKKLRFQNKSINIGLLNFRQNKRKKNQLIAIKSNPKNVS